MSLSGERGGPLTNATPLFHFQGTIMQDQPIPIFLMTPKLGHPP